MRALVLILAAAAALFGQGSVFGPVTASRIDGGSGAPAASACNQASEVGKVYVRRDTTNSQALFYTCAKTGSATYAWLLPGGASAAVTGAHFLTSQAESGLSAEVNLGGLSSGLLAIAVAGGVATPSTYAGASCGTGAVSAIAANGSVTCIQGQIGPVGPAGPVGPGGQNGTDGAPGIPGYSPNALQSGGGVTWTSGLNFTVSATTYLIGSTQYTAAQTSVTLDAAHETLNRIDVIAVDDTGSVVVVTGTAAEAPAKPSVDPSSQLELTWVRVDAGQATPTGIASTLVYAENAGTPTEWAATKSGAGVAVNSTASPITGTYDILFTAATSGQYAQLAPASGFDLSTRNTLNFAILSTAAWSSKRSVQIAFYSGSARAGSIVTLNEGAFGFSTSNTATAQNLSVPLGLFAVSGTVDALRFTVAGSQTAIGFKLDDISLQGGAVQPTAPTALTPCGTWNPTQSYAVNCVVQSGNISYYAKVANTNSTPNGTANANWAPLTTKTAVLQAVVFEFTTDTATGDGKYYIYVDSSLNGMNLTAVNAQVITAGTTNTTDVQIARCAAAASGDACSGTVADMLSTKLTVDSGENSSSTAATAAVINTSNDDVSTGQVLRIDVDAVSTTAAKGLIVTLTFQLP